MFGARCRRDPECAANWYLLAIAELSQGHASAAARYFGRAYHLDDTLESAALFTFACLKAAAQRSSQPLQEHIEQTWREMERPRLGTSRHERMLLELVEESGGISLLFDGSDDHAIMRGP